MRYHQPSGSVRARIWPKEGLEPATFFSGSQTVARISNKEKHSNFKKFLCKLQKKSLRRAGSVLQYSKDDDTYLCHHPNIGKLIPGPSVRDFF